MISGQGRTICVAAAMLCASSALALAQQFGGPQPPAQPGAPAMNSPAQSNPAQVCQRLEQQLAAVDRGGSNDPARADQIRRFEEAAAKQQSELDRQVARARQMDCQSTGFFDLFRGGPNPQCAPLNSQISQMRANLDRINNDLQRIQRAGVDYERDGQRRALLVALSRNDCGPQYRQAAAQQQQQNPGLFDNIFGNNSGFGANSGYQTDAPGNSYRTVCVRTCDGYFFPISFSTSPGRFADDQRTCQRMCPAAEAVLYTHRNPGEDMNQAVSAGGRLYTELPSAFKFRQEFNAACSCKRQGESWADAMKGVEDRGTIEQGDIVVTEDRAKVMNAPRDAKGRPILPANTRGKPDPKASAAAGAPAPAAAPASAPAATEPASDAPKPPIRTVGPQLGPVR